MVSTNKPSTNKVGFFAPTSIKTGIEAGEINVQDKVVIEPHAFLCCDGHPIIVGDINVSTNHLHPGEITVERNAWVGHIGDDRKNLLFLGKKADGALIINGGRVILEKGHIKGSPDCKSTITVNDGLLTTQSIELLDERSSITLRHGMIKTGSIKGPFRIWVYGGMLSIEKSIETNTINLTGTGALLFAPKTSLDPASIGAQGINFVGDGGVLVVQISNPGASLSKMFGAEAFFEGLRKEGKIRRDGEVIANFRDFKMDQIVGKKGRSFAVLRPIVPGKSKSFIMEKLKKIFYGEYKSLDIK